jgi:hypothetical protein
MMLGGLLIGYALGMQESPELGPPVEEVILKREPVLTLKLPEGALAFVNGREIPAAEAGAALTIKPPAGESQLVRIELEGHKAVEKTLTLDHNEELSLSVEFEELRKRRR